MLMPFYKTQIKAGQKFLINGATGAIGSALLQFAKQKGKHYLQPVIRITLPFNSMGFRASKIVDYTHKDFTDTQ